MNLHAMIPRDHKLRHEWWGAVLRASIARQIRGLREREKWSRSALGKKLGLRARGVALLENEAAKSFPSTTMLIKIARVFDVALCIRFEAWGESLAWVVNSSGAAILPFTRELELSQLVMQETPASESGPDALSAAVNIAVGAQGA